MSTEQPTKKRRAKGPKVQTDPEPESVAQDHAEPTAGGGKPKQTPKAKKPPKPVDRFGSLAGSGRARINDVLSSSNPQTNKEIAERASVPLGKVAKYLLRSVKTGTRLGQQLAKTEDGRWFLKEV
jgi:hypothetical protein